MEVVFSFLSTEESRPYPEQPVVIMNSQKSVIIPAVWKAGIGSFQGPDGSLCRWPYWSKIAMGMVCNEYLN